MCRVLEVCCELDGGGIDRYVYNYCTRIKEIHFDYTATDGLRGILEPLLEEHGSEVFKVPKIRKSPVKYYRALKNIIQKGNYDAVHVHLGHKSFLALLAAKKCGIKSRIVHAHIAFVPENLIQRIVRAFCTVLTRLFATELAACGVDAAKWVWGEKQYCKGNVKILNNAIETDRFSYSRTVREKLRQEFGIKERQIVIGHVGRLSDQKNQLRLVEIFGELLKVNSEAVLLLVGRGEKEQEIKNLAQEMGIYDKILLLGVRDDVARLLNMLDVFVFPSKFEGFPFALIEAQCNGLRCVCADTITPLVNVTDVLSFLSLDDSNELWVEKILSEALKGHSPDAKKMVVEAGFDIDREVAVLTNFYKKSINQC